MNRSAVVLAWLLRLNGVILLSAAAAIALPVDWMREIHGWLGFGEFPDRPVVVYLARSCALLYAVHGAVLLWVGLYVRRYAGLIPLIAWLHVAIGLVLLAVDLTAPMPWWWLVSEGPPIAGLGILYLALWTHCRSLRAGRTGNAA